MLEQIGVNRMKKLLSIITILSLLIPHTVFADIVSQSQRMLNQLGYNAGPVDGAYGGKTKRALEAFYAKSGGSYDGKLNANELADLNAAMEGVEHESQNKPKAKPTNPGYALKKYRTKLIQPVINSRHFAHYKTSQLRNVKIPKDFDFVDERRLRFLMEQGEYRIYAKQWANQYSRNGRRYQADGCKNVLQHFLMSNERDKPLQLYTRDNKKLMVITGGNHEKMQTCVGSVPMLMHQDYKFAINEMSDIILHHATYQNVRESWMHPRYLNDMQYQKYHVLARTAEFYAYFKDLMPLTPEEHGVITDYFDTIFAGNVFHTQQRRAQCDINDPSRNATTPNKLLANKNGQSGIGINGCGTYAFAMTNAGLLYSISTNNAELFEQAKKNATHMLGSFDDEGLHVVQASRGALAWGYHTDTTIQLSYMAEIFYSLGYDFYEHKMPRSGIKVKDVMFKHWEVVNDHTVLSKYAQYNKGVYEKWTSAWDKVSTHQATLREKPWRHIALSSPRFINTYVDTLAINGRDVDLKQVVASKRGGKNNWYNQWMPIEYLYYMNNDIEIDEINLFWGLDDEKIRALKEEADTNTQNIINLILSNE